MFLFMAFNEPRILNQSTIKENKQGHPEDSEDHLKKKKKERKAEQPGHAEFIESLFSYSAHEHTFPNYFITFLHLYVRTNTPLHKITYFTHTGSIHSCLEMALFGISLNSRGTVCRGLIRCYVKSPTRYSLVQFGGT